MYFICGTAFLMQSYTVFGRNCITYDVIAIFLIGLRFWQKYLFVQTDVAGMKLSRMAEK